MSLKVWVRAMRLPFLQASLLPFFIGFAQALYNGYFDLQMLLISLAGVVALHIAANMLNDYFDFKSGDDLMVRHNNPFAGGSRILPSGLIDLGDHLRVSLLMLAFGLAAGAYVTLVRGWPVLLLTLIAAISVYFYTGPPLKLAHRGLGEFVVGMNFGLIAVGSYLAQTGSLGLESVLACLLMGVLTSAILWINEFPDVAPDSSVGKRTLVVRMGFEKASLVFALLVGSSYVMLASFVLLGLMPTPSLLALLSLPYAAKAAKTLRRSGNDPDALIPGNLAMLRMHLGFGLALIASYLLCTLLR